MQQPHERWLAAGRLTVLALALCAAPAHATIVEKLSLEQLAERSERIVHGVVRTQWVGWSEDRRRILTWTEVEVLADLKGEPGPVLVVTPGGEIDGLRDRPSGTPQLRFGDEVVLFLAPSRLVEGAWVHYAMSASVLRVDGERGRKLVRRELEGLGFAVMSPDGPMRIEHPPQPVEQLGTLESVLTRIRRTVSP